MIKTKYKKKISKLDIANWLLVFVSFAMLLFLLEQIVLVP
jgi:hypothetical protein